MSISLGSLACKGFPSGYSKSVCVSACTKKAPNLRCCFLKRRLTNIPRRRHPADGQLSSLYPASLSFSSFWRRVCDAVLSASCLFEHTLTTVCVQREYQSGRKYNVRTFGDHQNVLYIFDQTCIVLKSGWSSTARMPGLVVSPPSLSHSHPPTPPPSRWPALITLLPLAMFQLVWRCLCDARLSSSLVRNTRFCCLVHL